MTAAMPPTPLDCVVDRDAAWVAGSGTVEAPPLQLRRRRAGSWRLPVLDCGCHDPWSATPWPAHNVESSRQAWAHLSDAGLMSELVDAILRGAA